MLDGEYRHAASLRLRQHDVTPPSLDSARRFAAGPIDGAWSGKTARTKLARALVGIDGAERQREQAFTARCQPRQVSAISRARTARS